MTNFRKPLGIVGGIGPAATSFAFGRLIQICQSEYKAVQDTDFPRVYVANVPQEGIDETGLSAEPHPGAVTDSLATTYTLFANANVAAVYLSCNTLQLHRPEPGENEMVQINPIEQGISFIKNNFPTARVTILASRYTRQYGLYENNQAHEGLTFVPVDEEIQKIVDHLIYSAMGGFNLEHNRAVLRGLCEKLLSECDVVVLGCTELSLLADQKKNIENGVVDSQEVALRELLEIGTR